MSVLHKHMVILSPPHPDFKYAFYLIRGEVISFCDIAPMQLCC